jgi:hypothetical protein
MQDDDHIYNAMHSDEITDGSTSMQNHHKPPVHGSERLPSILDQQAVGLETAGHYYSISMG